MWTIICLVGIWFLCGVVNCIWFWLVYERPRGLDWRNLLHGEWHSFLICLAIGPAGTFFLLFTSKLFRRH